MLTKAIQLQIFCFTGSLGIQTKPKKEGNKNG
jgi:hypothetical protein